MNDKTESPLSAASSNTLNERDTVSVELSKQVKSSPLIGWLSAGSDLIAAKLDGAAAVVSQALDNTHETINSMQAKGVEVEADIKRALNPMALLDNAQKLVMSTPLFSVLSGGGQRHQKAQQLDLLNAKVDLLVEQVALLAAKQAAAKTTKQSSTKAVAKPAAANPATTKQDAEPDEVKAVVKKTQAKTTAKSPAKSTAQKTPAARTVRKTAAKPSTTKASRSTAASKKTPSKNTGGTTASKPEDA